MELNLFRFFRKRLRSPPKILVLCVSLRRSDRRAGFAEAAARCGIDFQFVDAITREDLLKGNIPKGCKVDLSDMTLSGYDNAHPRRQHAPLLYTEIGCAYSHIACWQSAKRQDADFLVVFEDDAEMLRPFAPEDFAGEFDLKYVSTRVPVNEKGEAFGGYGTDGYILSREGRRKVLRIFSGVYMPVDLQLIVHTKSQIAGGHPLANYRRKNSERYHLTALVARDPVCRHRDGPSLIL